MVNSSEKRSCLSGVVQWCFCAFALVLCGYSLVRVQRLEERLKVLEDWHLRVEDTTFSFPQTKELVLKRETRDVADCVCPSEITLQKKWKGIRGCFTRELKRQEKLRGGDSPGPRKSEYSYFQQLQFLRNVVTTRDPDDGPDYIYYEAPDLISVKEEGTEDPLREEGFRRSKKFKGDDDEDRMFLLSMLSTLKRIPVSKKMSTKIKLMTVLDEATRNLDES